MADRTRHRPGAGLFDIAPDASEGARRTLLSQEQRTKGALLPRQRSPGKNRRTASARGVPRSLGAGGARKPAPSPSAPLGVLSPSKHLSSGPLCAALCRNSQAPRIARRSPSLGELTRGGLGKPITGENWKQGASPNLSASWNHVSRSDRWRTFRSTESRVLFPGLAGSLRLVGGPSLDTAFHQALLRGAKVFYRHLGDSFHKLIPQVVILFALLPQAGSIEEYRLRWLECAGS
jgi:hypothetical protein